MADNEIEIEILEDGTIKLTTDLISDPALHLVADEFVKNVEKNTGNKFQVTPHKQGKAHGHTHTHADGTTHAH